MSLSTAAELESSARAAEAAADRVKSYNDALIVELDKTRAEINAKTAIINDLAVKVAALEKAVDDGIVRDPASVTLALTNLCRTKPEIVAAALTDLVRAGFTV